MVGNVFVKARAGLLLRQQEFTVSVRKLERNVAEKEHFAALQLVTVPGRLLQVKTGYVHDCRTAGYARHSILYLLSREIIPRLILSRQRWPDLCMWLAGRISRKLSTFLNIIRYLVRRLFLSMEIIERLVSGIGDDV